jgi:hypothetical protein
MKTFLRRQVEEYNARASWERASWVTWRVAALLAIGFIVFVFVYALFATPHGCGC